MCACARARGPEVRARGSRLNASPPGSFSRVQPSYSCPWCGTPRKCPRVALAATAGAAGRLRDVDNVRCKPFVSSCREFFYHQCNIVTSTSSIQVAVLLQRATLARHQRSVFQCAPCNLLQLKPQTVPCAENCILPMEVTRHDSSELKKMTFFNKVLRKMYNVITYYLKAWCHVIMVPLLESQRAVAHQK